MHFRKASDKVTITDLTTPFRRIKDNNSLIETINELLDARKPLPRLESMKSTSKQEFLAALGAGGAAIATGVGKLFLNKIPMGIDRWAEMIAIWATITSLAVAAKTVPRAIATTLSSDFGKLLKEDLNIIVFKNDKNNNKIAATVKTIKIGTLEEFLTKQDDLIYDALKKNGITNDYLKEFDDKSASVLMDAYQKIRKIDTNTLRWMAGLGIVGATYYTPQISAKLRGEPSDYLFRRSPETQTALPPKTILDPTRDTPITQDQIRGNMDFNRPR
jgi:hypothetical protein